MADYTYEEAAWHAAQRGRLWYRLWKPTACRALAVLLHGFGEHGGRYRQVAETLAQRGICVAVPDLWGHGRSDGPRGAVGDLDSCLDDLTRVTTDVFLPRSAQSRFAVFGHSFGGLLAIAWAQRRSDRLASLVAQSPLLEFGFQIPRWKKVLALLLARAWPSAALSMDLRLEALSHDPAVVAAYRTDPLVHNRMSASTYQSILRTRDRVCAAAADCQVPVLLLCGSADAIISVQRAQQWFAGVPCEKRQAVFPDTFHELHHEPVRDQALQMAADWMLAHAG